MDIEKICASLRVLPTTEELLTAEKALYALQAENEKLRAELEQVKREQCRIPKGYALVKLELLEELDNFRDLGPLDRLHELAQAHKENRVLPEGSGWFVTCSGKKLTVVMDIEAALRREQDGE